MAKVAAEDLDLNHVNVETAFLNLTLQEEIYMQIPNLLREFLPELKGVEDAYLKLNKSLYGLKQAPREWFYMVKSFFESIGLKSADADPNLFIGNRVYILLFVDDMLVAGKRQHIDVAKAKIIKEWKCKNLGPAEVFVGFQNRSRLYESNTQATPNDIHQQATQTAENEQLQPNQAFNTSWHRSAA
jgi:ATP-binding cassette subfamily B (MDR/TAP) protein 1